MAAREIEAADRHQAEPRPTELKGWIDRACQLLCNVAIVVMVVLIGAEALLRQAGIALEMADEIGGYMLVAVSFLSLSVCQTTHAFHHLDLVQPRLSPRGRAISAVVFDLLSLAFALILLWQLGRLEWISWTSGDVAPTELLTPLWLPRLSMPLGAAAVCVALARSLLVHVRQLASVLRAEADAR
jgi:TRAP-type C4-dicarboxylate transport system permease small subunit